MTPTDMLKEVGDLSRITKSRWRNGFASITAIDDTRWCVLIYDNECHSTSFPSPDPAIAFAQARAWLNKNQPMTTDQLAEILGVEAFAS